jgi:cytoskeletal protein CcmA (bactofilin family)
MLGSKKNQGVAKIDTLVGHNTRIEGDVYCSGGLHVDGEIVGNVIAESDSGAVLTLSEKGRIQGEVRVPHLILNGKVVGDVFATERVELASQACVDGNVHYKLIEMAIGAEVNGQLVHTTDKETDNYDVSSGVEENIQKDIQQDIQQDDDDDDYELKSA